MYQSVRQVEWHFVEEENDDALSWQTHLEEQLKRKAQTELEPLRQPNHLYTLLLGIALIYGVVLYVVWGQMERRMTLLEGGIAAADSQLFRLQSRAIETPMAQGGTSDFALPDFALFETDSLRFMASARSADMVSAIALQSEAKYRQLHQDFGLLLPMSPDADDKLTIVVDPQVDDVTNCHKRRCPWPQKRSADLLFVTLAKLAAAYYEIPEADALTNEIFMSLSVHVFNKALTGREIQPQWQAMAHGLKFYLQNQEGHQKNWPQAARYLRWRHLAQSRSIDLALQMHGIGQMQIDDWTSYTSNAAATADPLIEYILETYGHDQLSALLHGFEQYDTWEDLTPALFNIPASEFEKNWHAYLKKEYPLAEEAKKPH